MIFWTIFAGLTLMEDGFKEYKSGGVSAFRRIQRQSQYLDRKTQSSRFPRGSEALATKLGPSFHTQPPTKYSFSNDTGIYLYMSTFLRKYYYLVKKFCPKFTKVGSLR